jgi:hypothetical protein
VAGGRRGGGGVDPSACGRDGGESTRFGLRRTGLFLFFPVKSNPNKHFLGSLVFFGWAS